MNTGNIKKYAPKARTRFIETMTRQAARYGISAGHEGGLQILDDCLEIDLPGLDTDRVRELKLDGTQDETLYHELLLAQCRALFDAMPFLFEPLDDAIQANKRIRLR
jgi:hypothetical protein